MIRRARNALRRLLVGNTETPLSATIAYHSWLVENGRLPCTSALEDYLRERRFVAALAG